MANLLNASSGNPPALKVYLNLGNLVELPDFSIWHERPGNSDWEKLQNDGFEGVQFSGVDPLPEDLTLPHCGSGRINEPSEADDLFQANKELGHQGITLHLGWGLEDDDTVDRLVEAVLTASEKHQLPAFIETHRATITQDIWRTVKLTERFPEIRFNGDFSHYYCGQEMVYGDFEEKLAFMQPIFDRIGFMHGRIASSGCMQMPIDDTTAKPTLAVGEADYLEHFRMFWIRAMKGFLKQAGNGDFLVFTPELLWPAINYARVFPDPSGSLVEESDRYAQALLYRQLARDCFENARSSVGKPG